MNVLLVGNYETDAQESMQRFAKILEIGLTDIGHSVRVIRPEPLIGRLYPGRTGLGKWLGYIDKFGLFPAALRQAIAWADVVHICDHSNAMYTHYLQAVPHVVTCNDMLAIRSAQGEIPENPTSWTGRQLQQWILKGLNHAQRAACISENTRQDLLRVSNLPKSAVSVVYMGLNYPYRPMPTPQANECLTRLGVSEQVPFILHVGANHWYKNRLGVLKIFQALLQRPNLPHPLSLVLAGSPWTPEMHEFVESHQLQDRVVQLVGVDNEDLRALYSSATALLFPSLQEGFGWPISEAQACGCPVFTSNRPPMTEVGGNAAVYIDPDDPESAADAIARHLPDLDKLKPAGLENVQRFTVESMVKSYIELYQSVIQQHSAVPQPQLSAR